MSQRRPFLVSILAIGLGLVVSLTMTPPVAADSGKHRYGHLVEPSRRIDGLLGIQANLEDWHRALTLPPDENPFPDGNGETCVPLGHHGRILLALGPRCTVKKGTTVFIIGIAGFCSNLDPPPFFAESAAEQRRCIIEWFRGPGRVKSIWVTVNGHRLGNIHTRRYKMLASQARDQLRSDNIFGYPPKIITYVLYGWGAWLVDLPVGTHRIHSITQWADGSEPHDYNPVITVVP
jgi:hypothetical protein